MHKIQLKIRGQEFTLKSEHDPEYLLNVAEFVDRKIEDIFQRTRIVDTQKLALLTAINIADDLFQTKKELEKLQGDIELRTGRILNLLDVNSKK